MAITIAELTAKVIADVSNFDKNMRSVDSKLDETHGKSKAAFGGLGTAAKLAGAAVAGGVALAINAAADFESSLNTLQAVSGATSKEMEAMRKQAIALGNDTKLPGTSARDAAQAMTEMVKAGVSLRDTQKGVRDVLVLSAAAEIDNARAAEIASNALNTFGLKGKDVKWVTDQLANSANASSISIEDAADSMKMAGAIFSGVQGPTLGAKGAMHELAVATALLGNAGIKGSDAGTSLKQTLLQLTGPTEKAKSLMEGLMANVHGTGVSEDGLNSILTASAGVRRKYMEELEKNNKGLAEGGDIAYTASGKMRPLHEIIELVGKSTANMTAEQKNATITQLFGADASRTVIALLRQQGDGWDNMSDKLNKVGGAQDVANAKMKGFNGSMEAFKSSLDTLAITFGSALLPAATQVMHIITDLTGVMTEHQTVTKILVGVLATFAGAVIAINTGFRIYRSVVMAATIAQAALNLVMDANPVVLIAAAIIGLGLALVVAYKHSETFRNIVQGALEIVKKVADDLWEGIKVGIHVFGEMADGAEDGVNAVVKVFRGFEKAVSTAFDFLADIPKMVAKHWKEILAVVMPASLLFTNAFDVRDKIVDLLGDVVGPAKKKATEIVKGIVDTIADAPDKLKDFSGELISKISGFVTRTTGSVVNTITSEVGKWASEFAHFPSKITDFGGELLSKITGFIPVQAVTSMITGKITEWGNAFKDFPGKIFDFGKDLATKFMGIFSDAGIAGRIVERFTDWGDAFKQFPDKLWDFGKELGNKFMSIFSDAGIAGRIIERLTEWGEIFKNFPDKLWDFAKELGSKFMGIFSDAGIAGKITERLGEWGDLFKALPGKIFDFSKELFGKVMGVISAAQIGPAILDRIGDWAEFFGELPGKAAHAISRSAHQVYNAVMDIFDGLADWVKKVLRISSPSQVFEDIGENIVRGLIQGLKRSAGHLTDVAKDLALKLVKELKKIPKDIWNVLPDDIQDIITGIPGAAAAIGKDLLGPGAPATQVGGNWGPSGDYSASLSKEGAGGVYYPPWDRALSQSEALHVTGYALQSLNDIGPDDIRALLYQAQTESGWHTGVVNKWDSNWTAGHPSIGYLQTIRPTFESYGGGNIWNPYDNASAAVNYMMAAYGHIIGTGHGYAQGAIVRAGFGGGLVRVGEGLYDEAILPLPSGWRNQKTGDTYIVINVEGNIVRQDQVIDWVRAGIAQRDQAMLGTMGWR